MGWGVLGQKLSKFLNCTEVLLVWLLGVGGSLTKILAIFQKYSQFDIVLKPKVLPVEEFSNKGITSPTFQDLTVLFYTPDHPVCPSGCNILNSESSLATILQSMSAIDLGGEKV